MVAASAAVRHRTSVILLTRALLEQEMTARLSAVDPDLSLGALFAGCDPASVEPILERIRQVTLYGIDFTLADGSRPYREPAQAQAAVDQLLGVLLGEYDRAMREIYGGSNDGP